MIRPIVPIIVKYGENRAYTYAMIDSAANTSAIKLDLLDLINGHISQKNCKLATFGKNVRSQRDFTEFEIMPIDESFTLDVKNALVGNILTTERDRPPSNNDIRDLTYMKDVSFVELDDPTVAVILDAKFAWTWVGGETRLDAIDSPIAVKTRFGWTLIGPQLDDSPETDLEANVCLLDTEVCPLRTAIRHIFRHDFVMSEGNVAPPLLQRRSPVVKGQI